MCCSHCCPTNPSSAFDLLIEYYWWSLTNKSGTTCGATYYRSEGERQDLAKL